MVDRIAAAAIVGRELEEAEHAVQGVVVSGLTADDLRFLDLFEGDVSSLRLMACQTGLLV